MKVGKGKSRSRLAMCVSLMMVWGVIPVQGQGIQTRFLAPVQEESLESPLYESVLTQGIEKLEPTGSSESAVPAGQPVRDVNLTSGNGFQAYAGYGSRQFRSPSIPMNRDKTPVASDRNSLPLERTGISEGSNSPMYVVVLASAIEKLEPAQFLTKPVQKPQDPAKSKSAWPA